jgi:hypothetical protein
MKLPPPESPGALNLGEPEMKTAAYVVLCLIAFAIMLAGIAVTAKISVGISISILGAALLVLIVVQEAAEKIVAAIREAGNRA